MRPCQLRSTGQKIQTGVSPADGAVYRRAPESPHNPRFAMAKWVPVLDHLGEMAAVFPPLPTIYRAMHRSRQGRSTGESGTIDLC
jgi:hypothetical protein